MKFWDRITLFSFVLTVLVIWLHSIWAISPLDAEGEVSFSLELREVVADGLGQMAVPGFFCLSGFLFFRNLRISPSKKNIIGVPWPGARFFLLKWRKRVSSLLIPYLLWNFFYYVVYALAQRADLSVTDLLQGIFLQKYNPVFWYLRQLIVLNFLTPCIFWLINNKILAFFCETALLILSVFYDILPFHIVNEDALFYYVFGAMAAIHFGDHVIRERSENQDFWKCVSWISILILVFSVFLFAYLGSGRFLDSFSSYRLSLLGKILYRESGAVFVFSMLNLIVDRANKNNPCMAKTWQSQIPIQTQSTWKLLDDQLKSETMADIRLPEFMRCNFLLFALHYLEIRCVLYVISILEHNTYAAVFRSTVSNEFADLIVFLMMPVFCILITYVINRFLLRFFPGLLSIISGKRC